MRLIKKGKGSLGGNPRGGNEAPKEPNVNGSQKQEIRFEEYSMEEAERHQVSKL